MTWADGDLLSPTNLNNKGFGSFYNVRDFGAVGNGVADDTASIQSALNTAATPTFGRHAAVLVPSGLYSASSLIVPDGVHFTGAGWGGFGSLSGSFSVTEIKQRAGANCDFITFKGQLGSGTTYIGPLEISNMLLSGNTSNTTGCGISFTSLGGSGTPLDMVKLHNLFIRSFPKDGIYFPDGAIPIHLRDLYLWRNKGYGINYSGETGVGDTQAVHFDNISGDANLGGALIFCKNVNVPYGSLLFTNIKSEMARNDDYSNATGQDNAIVLHNCGGPVAIHGVTHISSVTISATSHLAPGAAIKIQGGACPEVFFTGVATRQRPNDDIGETWTLLDSTRSSAISVGHHAGFYGSNATFPISAASNGKITMVLGDQQAVGTIGSPDFQLQGVTPAISFFESDAATNTQAWFLGASTGQLTMRTLQDTGAPGDIFLRATRSGASFASLQLSLGTLDLTAANLSVKTTATSFSSANVGAGQLAFFVGGTSGASIGLRSGGTLYWFSSSASTVG